jgi:hypothetical protein
MTLLGLGVMALAAANAKRKGGTTGAGGSDVGTVAGRTDSPKFQPA